MTVINKIYKCLIRKVSYEAHPVLHILMYQGVPLLPLVITTGNPWVFQADPDPTPENLFPWPRVWVFHRSGIPDPDPQTPIFHPRLCPLTVNDSE